MARRVSVSIFWVMPGSLRRNSAWRCGPPTGGEYLPAVAPDGSEAAMPGDEPYAYYGTERSVAPHWRTVEATAEFLRRTPN